jgi:medium-chain acyl-[acyl-carrier-protein] hydrolase
MDVLTVPATPVATPLRRGDWAVRWRPDPAARIRLFCLPHTGAGAATYRTWAGRLPRHVELIAVRLPGREVRYREAPYTSAAELVPAMLAGLARWLDRPHAWFGHSLGALLAFEAARRLATAGHPPLALLVSGRVAPHLTPRQPPVHAAPTPAVLDRLRELAGTPEEVLADPHALAALLPTLRADFAVAETYTYHPGPPLPCPVAVFGGDRDPLADPAELDAWRAHTAAGCQVRLYPGDHFYLHRGGQPLIPAIAAVLSSVDTP